jgi:hypothetical protein
MKKDQKKGWFRLGGFEKDPLLTEADKRYYRRQLTKDEKELKEIRERTRMKDKDWLGRWIERFNIEGDFWARDKRPKIKENDWL